MNTEINNAGCETVMQVTITNPDIISFYKEHNHIDFEQTQLALIQFINFINIKEYSNSSDSTSQVNLTKSSAIIQIPTKTNNHPQMLSLRAKCEKAQPSALHKEYKNMEFILNNLNPTSTVINNTDSKICCDYIIKNNNILCLIN